MLFTRTSMVPKLLIAGFDDFGSGLLLPDITIDENQAG